MPFENLKGVFGNLGQAVSTAVLTPLAKTQEFVERPPLFTFAENVQSPGQKFVASIAQEVLNQPLRSLQAGGDIGKQLREGAFFSQPTRTIGNVAEAAMLPLMFVGGRGVAGTVGKAGLTKGIIQQPLRKVLVKGAKTGFKQGTKFGAGFGFLGGLSQGREAPDVPSQIVGALPSAAIGAAVGGVVGVPLGAIAQVAGVFKSAYPKASTNETTAAARLYIQDTQGKFRGRFPSDMSPRTLKKQVLEWTRRTVGKKEGETVFYDDLKKAIEIKFRDQRGFIRFGTDIGKTKAQLSVTQEGTKKVISSKTSQAVQQSFVSRMNEIRQTSSSQDELIKGVQEAINQAMKNSRGDKTVLSGVRTALNKEINGLTGSTGNYKADYVVRQEMKADPSIGKYIEYLEDRIIVLDDLLLRGKTPQTSIGRIIQKSEIVSQPTNIIIRKTPTPKIPQQAKIPIGQKERGFIKTVRESPTTTPEVAARVQGTYTPITNRATIQAAQQTVKANYDIAKQRVINEPLSADTNAIGQEIMRQAQNARRYDEAIEIAETLARKGTEAGQSVQAFSIWSRLTPEGMLRYATKTVSIANKEMGQLTKLLRGALGKQPTRIDTSDAKFITETMKQAQKVPPEQQASLMRSVMERISKKIPWGISDVIDEFRYNNMLSNPLTHLRNVVSNLQQTFITRPATLVAEGKPREAITYEIAALKALPNALDDFVKVIKKSGGLGRLDQPFRVRRLGIYNLPSDLMEGADIFFKRLIESGERARGAAEQAEKIAEATLFRSPLKPTEQGYLLNKIDDLTASVFQLRKVGLGWFIPFIRTPMNVAKAWIEFSPTGFATIPGTTFKRTQLAKAMLGSMVSLIGANYALQDKVTWQAPTDPKEKELFYASGRKPFSVKVGDKWIPLMTFGVFAWALGLPAAYKYHMQESRTAMTDGDIEKLAKSNLALLNFWSQQTFVSGIGGFVKLLEGDIDVSPQRILGNIAGQLKPFQGLQRYVAQVVDPVFRRSRTFAEQLREGVPGLTQEIPAIIEPTGEEARRNIFNFITPYGVGIQRQEFEAPLQARNTRLQENVVLTQMSRDFNQIEDRVKKLIDSGNLETARQIIQDNREVFRKGLLIKEARKKIRTLQDVRDKATTDKRLTDEQKQRFFQFIEQERNKHFQLLSNL